MKEPTFDKQGYPTEETLDFIRMAAGDWNRYMEFIVAAWDTIYGFPIQKRVEGLFTVYTLVTGGWSGNEEVLEAMAQNTLFNSFCKMGPMQPGGKCIIVVPG